MPSARSKFGSSDLPEGYGRITEHGTTIGDPATIVPHETVTITFVNRLRVIGTPGLDIEKYAYAEDESWTDVTSC